MQKGLKNYATDCAIFNIYLKVLVVDANRKV